MTRAVYLSCGGDVLLGDLCLNLFKKYFYDEIDTYYVGLNNHANVAPMFIYEFLRKWEKDPKVRIIYTPHGVGNGTPILQMLLNSKESALLLLEDDSLVFTEKVVDTWFRKLENTDVIGSPRYAAGEIADAAKKKYNLDYSGVGDKGFGWWPSFFLTHRQHLLNTSWDFGSTQYFKNHYYKELDHSFIEDSSTDTFTWASIQLRYMNLKSLDIPQNHSHPFDFTETDRMWLWETIPEYIHGGSLSSGWGGYLNVKSPPVTTKMEAFDIETRIAFWKIAAETGNEFDYKDFRYAYKRAILDLIVKAGLNHERIEKKYQGYRRLMKIE